MKFLRWLLLPFSLIYGVITWLRNKAFDLGVLKSQSFDVSTLVIGNLNTGGTGKTPHTEYFLSRNKGKRMAVISRGYGRKTKGFRFVEVSDAAELCGDEPLQVKMKFPDVPVAVCEDRVMAVPELLTSYPDTELIIFDDAFQHRYLKAEKYILLTSYDDLFTRDMMLPTGNLREFASGYKRADDIIVTKCPAFLTREMKEKIRDEIRLFPHQRLFFSRYHPGVLKNLSGEIISDTEFFKTSKLLAFSAIAHGDKWSHHMRGLFASVEPSLTYPDHHFFTHRDIDLLMSRVKKAGVKETVVMTTLKDAMRLFPYAGRLSDITLLYRDIDVEITGLDEDDTSESKHQKD